MSMHIEWGEAREVRVALHSRGEHPAGGEFPIERDMAVSFDLDGGSLCVIEGSADEIAGLLENAAAAIRKTQTT